MLLLLFVLGLCVGSFLNVLVERLPRNESVLFGRSHCDHCKHKLLWYELIPLVSFFIQKGKSRCCHKRLSFQYPLVELITGIGFVLLFRLLLALRSFSEVGPPLSLPSILYLLFSIVVFCSLLVIFIADLKYEIIPMEMIITGIIGIFVYQGMQFFVLHTSYFVLRDYFVGILFPAILAFLFFFCLWFFTKGRAMGDGDMYLSFLIGLITGFPKIIVSLYAAFLTGAAAGVILILQRKKGLKSHIPFGPFLIVGSVIALVFGDAIIIWWRTLW